MADFRSRVWRNERIYMVDFGRAPYRYHPTSVCPDVDRYGFTDDINPAEHGPIITGTVGQKKISVRFYRSEISTGAKLYAVPADGDTTIRMLTPKPPTETPLPSARRTTISFRPRRAGRTSIDIRYHWPDGPVIGRLYVEVRRRRRLNVRVHLVSTNGSVQPASFLGHTASGGTAAATHHATVIRKLIRDTNRILWPHGIYVRNRGTVNSAWTNATFGPANFPPAHPQAGTAIPAWRRIMRAMALSPNRSATAINIYIADPAAMVAAGIAVGNMAGLGPPVPWATNIGATWPNSTGGTSTGTGIWLHPGLSIGGHTLAHEFGHSLLLCNLTAAGAVNQWHSTGDFPVSRDDYLSRRRLMYNITSVLNSGNTWRKDVGSGNKPGAILTHRGLTRDGTFQESRRAYDNCTAANLYTA